MNKKLMAVAVAGALAAPALAFAQASTVQIYGKITYEYGIADQGDGRPNVDYADTPGGSNFGFKGEEKLGGGLSAWFQCESSADVRAMDQTGFCTRNSAVGFKGAFGNVHFGRWDTPMKRALNVGTVGATETGLLGMSFMAFGGSGGADATASADGTVRQRWKRREAGLSYYESPNFSGFQVLAAFSSGNAAADYAAVDSTANAKPRVQSLSATYNNGPIGIGLGYEKHVEFGVGTALGSPTAGDDDAWGISAAYTFAGPRLKVGATYLDSKYETGPGRELKKQTWTLGVEWNISGPHNIEAQYAQADDSKGNSLVAVGSNPASGSDTGANDYSIAYVYNFSKRTDIRLGYHKTDNDTNAKYKLGNTASLLTAGDSQSAYAMYISHKF
jgi:predicted porin